MSNNQGVNFVSPTALNNSLAGLTPTISALTVGTVSGNFDFGSTGTNFPGKYAGTGNAFEARYIGQINIPTTGTYTFDTASDDGSMLWIDGNTVVNNNYDQGITTRSGTVTLTAGEHNIEIGYFQGGGGLGLYADVIPPAGSSERLPLSWLSVTAPAYLSNTIGSLAGSGSVNLTAASLVVGSDNTSSTFSGTISGPGAWLQKIGTGTLTLTGVNNSYTGGTTISAGVLSIGDFQRPGQQSPGSVGGKLVGQRASQWRDPGLPAVREKPRPAS